MFRRSCRPQCLQVKRVRTKNAHQVHQVHSAFVAQAEQESGSGDVPVCLYSSVTWAGPLAPPLRGIPGGHLLRHDASSTTALPPHTTNPFARSRTTHTATGSHSVCLHVFAHTSHKALQTESPAKHISEQTRGESLPVTGE